MMGVPAFLKIGKVIAVNPENHSVDVAYLDGGFASNLPTLSAWAGSTHGVTFTPSPTYEKDVPQRKTYPNSVDMAYDDITNPDKTGQDQYVLVAQIEGSLTGLGMAGAIVVGYFYPQVSEMLFDEGEEGKRRNMLLFRHPSDVQATIEKDGKISIQHPNGTRITVGEDISPLDLGQKDYDKRYTLRRNLNPHNGVSVVVEAINDSEPKARVIWSADGEVDVWAKKQVRLRNFAGCVITLDEDGTITISAPGDITLSAGGIVRIQGTLIEEN